MKSSSAPGIHCLSWAYINCKSKNALSIIQSLDKIICVSDFIGRRVLSVSDMANVITLHNGVAIKTSSDSKVNTPAHQASSYAGS